MPTPRYLPTLVLPTTADAVSGGNHYNRGLVMAWRDGGGCSVRIDELESLSVTDRARAWLVDSVLTPRLPEVAAHRRPGDRLLVVAHYLSALDPEADASTRAAERHRLAGIDGFLATGTFAAERLRELWPDLKTLCVTPPIGSEFIGAPRTAPIDPPTAVVVASLIPCKGVLPLLQEIDRRVGEAESWRLDLAGRDDFEPDYAATCRELVDRSPRLSKLVRWLGVVAPAAMPARYRSASLIVSAATLETYGMALQEARFCGRPLFAIRAGNVPAHVDDGVNGRLFETHEALADALVGVMRDDAQRNRWIGRAEAATPASIRSWSDAADEIRSALDRQV